MKRVGTIVLTLTIQLVMVNSEKTEDSVCSKDVNGYGDPDGYSRDKFIFVLLGQQQARVSAIHPCVLPLSIPIEINSNPAGVRISNPRYGGKHLSNSGDKHLGIIIETYYLTDVLVHVSAPEAPFSQLIPVRLQGSEYFAVFPKNVAIERFFICVVTVSYNTTVQVGVKRFDNRTHNDVYVASLTFLDAFVVSEIFDTSGSRILSHRAVAVSCMFILHGNVGSIQSLPAKVLGKQFVLSPFPFKTDRKVRIVAVADSTYISQFNTTRKAECIPRGHVVDIDYKSDGWNEIIPLRANRPLLVLETVVTLTKTVLVIPVEQYNTFLMDILYTTYPYEAVCNFINFSPIELNFTLSVTDVVSSKKASAQFSTNTMYFDTREVTRYLAYMNETVYASGVINITSSAEFSGTCIITDEVTTFMLRPNNHLRVIYQDCRLLKHEARCFNCSSTYTDDCEGRDDTQPDDCQWRADTQPDDCEGRGDCEGVEEKNSIILICTIVTSVVLLAAFSMLAANQAAKYRKRKARRRIRPEQNEC